MGGDNPLDPWSPALETLLDDEPAWAQALPFMQKCGDNVTSDRCYFDPGSGKGYVVFEGYDADCNDSWLLLPGFTLLDDTFLALIWLAFLVYLFLGVAIISDVFMSSIEVITSKTMKIEKKDPKTGDTEKLEVDFWNPTVANLTLMALGSSAPEILLAVVETVFSLKECDTQQPGELGPSTIVGSAAYNLLIIIAVCMISVPDGEVRAISELPVFLTTAVFSLLAYMWMYVVYVEWTPDIITIEEAIITIIMFPVLVIMAYAADKRVCLGPRKDGPTLEEIEDGEKKPPFLLKRMAVVDDSGNRISLGDRKDIKAALRERPEEVGVMSKASHVDNYVHKIKERWNAGRFRINALRLITGGKHKTVKSKPSAAQVAPDSGVVESPSSQSAAFNFLTTTYSVYENAGFVKVLVMRTGPLATEATVCFHTEDGTASAGEDYKATSGELVFKSGVATQEIQVPIIDDNQWEPDETFHVVLTDASPGVTIGPRSIAIVTIIDDDDPGILGFTDTQATASELSDSVVIEVNRRRGCDGRVGLDYVTLDGSAKAGRDFELTQGTLEFDHGETSKVIEIPFVKTGSVMEVGTSFLLKLSNVTNGAQISKQCQCTITVVNDSLLNDVAMEVAERLKRKHDATAIESSSWAEQFKAAVSLESSVDDDGNEVEPDAAAMVMHYLCITWKVLFAFVPPTDIYGGWATFVVSLMCIGGVTCLVEQVASMMGCQLGIEKSITAITFVALGTSLPDTFASVQATKESDDADAAIGNVTGSNSVNVFLGLGIPWVVAAGYYELGKGCKYEVEAGTLGFSVALFTVCALLCLSCILARRFSGMGELGGNVTGKWASAAFMVSLWIVYLGGSVMKAKGVL